MNDYTRVEEALKKGVDPVHLCMTCPWDRFCITPPTMTSDEVDSRIKEAETKDNERNLAAGKSPRDSMPIGMMLSTLMLAGKDRQAEICPVLSLALRTKIGEQLSRTLKAFMQKDDDG